MTSNPFAALGKPKVGKVEYDEWGGAFTCSTPHCWKVVGIAKFIRDEGILTWQCPDGHISTIEATDD